MNYLLTKSKYIKGLQCKKALYLDTYKRNLGVFSPETLNKFKQGRAFEANFKAKFTNGIALDKQLGWAMDKYPSTTKKILAENREIAIFEAGFIHNETLVLTDVLVKNKDQSITIYEIKNMSKLTDVVLQDMSVQYYVCQSNLGNIQSFNIVLNDGKDDFVVMDVTDELQRNRDFVIEHIADLKKVLQSGEPKIPVGEQCNFPYECEFKAYCRGDKK
jgi:hypothetical protein